MCHVVRWYNVVDIVVMAGDLVWCIVWHSGACVGV